MKSPWKPARRARCGLPGPFSLLKLTDPVIPFEADGHSRRLSAEYPAFALDQHTLVPAESSKDPVRQHNFDRNRGPRWTRVMGFEIETTGADVGRCQVDHVFLSEAVQLEPRGSGDGESFLLPSLIGYHVRHPPRFWILHYRLVSMSMGFGTSCSGRQFLFLK